MLSRTPHVSGCDRAIAIARSGTVAARGLLSGGLSKAIGLFVVMSLAGCATPTPQGPAAADARIPLRLAAADREHLRAGMRQYLDSVQGILDALAQNKPDRIASSARKSGMASLSGVSLASAASLPPEFSMLSLDTHEKFDALASLAAQNARSSEILKRTSEILANCSACHGMYRLAGE